MNKVMKDNLCKSLRACGIQKDLALQILNIITKWYDNSGSEWTNSRIKDLRQWYETSLTGNPVPPEWFRHDSKGLPLGTWKKVFKLPIAKALAVLSVNTLFYESSLSEKQKEKFLHAIAGNGTQSREDFERLTPRLFAFQGKPKKLDQLCFPVIFDMTGSVPINNCHGTIHCDDTIKTAMVALQESWKSVPQVTFDFLLSQGMEGYMPLSVIGNEYALDLNRPHDNCVGRVSVLQQPQLKARIVGNPNRVTQVTLEPLKQLYMSTAKKLPTDVTHDQELGVHWVQTKLKQGIELAGSDLTSASDLLDVGMCLDLVDKVFHFRDIPDYKDFEQYFLEVCRSEWYCPALKQNVSWKQGTVLGTGPSFGLLTLSNNSCALYAWYHALQAGEIWSEWYDSFRVVGDDIVMLAPMEKYYTELIESIGGEINHSKTLKSNRVAEFAGRVITSDRILLKAIKFSEPSDNSFMEYMAQLGNQAKFLLKSRQKRAYEIFKYVPGILVEGPYMRDSYGIPLGDRYSWYLEEVEPALRRLEPDLQQENYSMTLLKARLSVDEANGTNSVDSREIYDEPYWDSGYLPEYVTPTFKVGGDPRLTKGKTALQVLTSCIEGIMTFESWQETRWSGLASNSSSQRRSLDHPSIETPLESESIDEDLDEDDFEL